MSIQSPSTPRADQEMQSLPLNLEEEIESLDLRSRELFTPKPASTTAAPSTEQILKERNKVHGDFYYDAYMAQTLKDTLHSSTNWPHLSYVQREALELICTKIGRICVGDHNHKDHWDDIAGYATLVSQRL